MENTIDGEIVFEQVPHLRSVQRFVRKRVAQWVEHCKELHGESAGKVKALFYVRFERVGGGHQIFCTIQLLIGNRIWKGTALAAGLHQALIQSIGHVNFRDYSPGLLR